MTEARITSGIFPTVPGLTPVVASFEYGGFDTDEALSIDCKVYSDEDNDRFIVTLASESKEYRGFYGSSDEALDQHCLLIRNRKTGKVRLVPARHCLFGRPDKREFAPKKSEAAKRSNTEEDREQTFRTLSKVFGSKKMKRKSELYNKLNLSGSKEEDIKRNVADVTVNEEDMKQLTEVGTESLEKLLPPCNRKADKVEEVYPLSGLLSESELKLLKDTAAFVLKNPDNFGKSGFLTTLVSSFKERNVEIDLDKMALLLYVDCLLKYLSLSSAELKQKSINSKICPFSYQFAMKILREFTLASDKSRTRPNYLKDKAICYIIVLLCLVGNFKVSVNVLTSCIQNTSFKRLQQLFRVVGLIPISFGSKETMKLSIPLPEMPSLFKSKAKKKR